MKSTRLGKIGVGVIAMLLVLLAPASVLGASFKLEGQSKGSATWISDSLRNWQDLDYIPVRVYVTGRAVCHKSLTISFPHLNRLGPGFDSLSNFTTSTNVVITQEPKLSQPSCGDWSYTFEVNYTGWGPGHIEFLARLAAGASLNGGDSLKLKGSMGELAIRRPAPSDSIALGLRQGIERAKILPGAGFQVAFATEFNRFYGIQYSSELQNWKTAQTLILGQGSLAQWIDTGPPVTESSPETQPMRFYRLFLLPYQLHDCKKDCDRGHHHGCGCSNDDEDDDDDDEDDDEEDGD